MFFSNLIIKRGLSFLVLLFLFQPLFSFQVDPVNEIPTAVCISSLITARLDNAGQLTLYAQDLDIGSFDAETPFHELRYTVVRSGEAPILPDDGGIDIQNTITIDCSGDGTIIDLDMWVWDSVGQGSFCTVNVLLTGECPNGAEEEEQVLNGSGIITGKIFTENGTPVKDALVIINSKLPGYPIKKLTDEDGLYEFRDSELFENYTLSVAKDDFHENGITVLDLLLIMQHILDINPFDSVSEMVAADVNNDRKVSAGDLIELRRLVLGIIPSFSANASWRFANESALKNLPSFTWPLEELIQIPILEDSMPSQNFVGIKVGDVNFDAESLLNKPVKSNRRSVDIILPLKIPVNQELIEIPIHFDTNDPLYAFQFQLHFQGLDFFDIISDDFSINDQNIYENNGVLTVAWANVDAYNSKKPMILRFKPKGFGSKSISIGLNSAYAHSVTYVGKDLLEHKITSNFRVQNSDLDVKVYPNPASHEGINITFSNEIEEITNIELFDMSGKSIYKTTTNTPTDRSQILIPGQTLIGHKMVVYQIKSRTLTYIGKFAIIE